MVMSIVQRNRDQHEKVRRLVITLLSDWLKVGSVCVLKILNKDMMLFLCKVIWMHRVNVGYLQ